MGWTGIDWDRRAPASNLDPLSHHVTDRRPLSAHHDMSADTTAQSSSASKPCQRVSVSVSVSVAESLSIHHTGASSHRRIVASYQGPSESGVGGSRIQCTHIRMCHASSGSRSRSILQGSGSMHSGPSIKAAPNDSYTDPSRADAIPISISVLPLPHLSRALRTNELAHLSPKY